MFYEKMSPVLLKTLDIINKGNNEKWSVGFKTVINYDMRSYKQS